MRRKAVFMVSVAIALAAATQSYASCDITEFKDISYGNLSRVQRASYLYKLSKGEWENKRNDIGVDVVADGIPIGATYSEMHSWASNELKQIDSSSEDDLATSLFTASLSHNDLQAYMACQSAEFLVVAVSSFEPESGEIILNWSLPPGGSLSSPFKVTASKNVSNAAEISETLHDIPVNTTIQNYQMLVEKKDPKKPAILTIASGQFSRVAYLPAPPVAPITPVAKQLSFDANSGNIDCNSGGNFDDHRCTLLDQTIIPDRSGEVVVSAKLKLDISDIGIHDPHREAYIDIVCANNKLSEYPGKKNVDHAVVDYDRTARCEGRAGQPMHIALTATPRGGSSVIVTGKVDVDVP